MFMLHLNKKKKVLGYVEVGMGFRRGGLVRAKLEVL